MGEPDEPEVSAELSAARKKLYLVSNIFFILGGATIKANEAKAAAEILDYANGLVMAAQDEVNSIVATEELGRPVTMEGSKLSLAAEPH